METYDKLTKALKRVKDVDLICIPLTISLTNIIAAKSNASKRNLVRAVRFIEREIMTRKLYEEAE